MAMHPMLARFVENLPDERAYLVHDLLAAEVSGGLAEVVEFVDDSGDRKRALLHAENSQLILYTLADAGGQMPYVHMTELGSLSGARVTEVRLPTAQDDHAPASLPTTRFVAEHGSFPGGRLE